MDFRQMEQFLSIVESGSVTRAAAALHITQPSLSQTIRALERELKTPLFYRIGRGLVPTQAGVALIKPIRRILRDVEDSRAIIARSAKLGTGRLEIGILPNNFDSMLPVVKRFRTLYQGVSLHFYDPVREEKLFQAVRDGRVNIGFAPLNPARSEMETRDLTIDVLAEHEIFVMLPPGQFEALPDPIPITELPFLPTIAAPYSTHARHAVEVALRTAGVNRELAVITELRNTQVELVLHGVGMAWTIGPQSRQAVRRGAVVRRMDPPLTLEFAAIYREDHRNSLVENYLKVFREIN